jgi:hypothetical protein
LASSSINATAATNCWRWAFPFYSTATIFKTKQILFVFLFLDFRFKFNISDDSLGQEEARKSCTHRPNFGRFD